MQSECVEMGHLRVAHERCPWESRLSMLEGRVGMQRAKRLLNALLEFEVAGAGAGTGADQVMAVLAFCND